MALSTAVFVGGIEPWKASLIEKASKLKVAPGYKEGADVGPLISPEARQRCIDLITSAEQDVSPFSVLIQVFALHTCQLCSQCNTKHMSFTKETLKETQHERWG